MMRSPPLDGSELLVLRTIAIVRSVFWEPPLRWTQRAHSVVLVGPWLGVAKLRIIVQSTTREGVHNEPIRVHPRFAARTFRQRNGCGCRTMVECHGKQPANDRWASYRELSDSARQQHLFVQSELELRNDVHRHLHVHIPRCELGSLRSGR